MEIFLQIRYLTINVCIQTLSIAVRLLLVKSSHFPQMDQTVKNTLSESTNLPFLLLVLFLLPLC